MFKNRGGDDYLARAGGWKIKKLFGRTRRSSWPKTIIARRLTLCKTGGRFYFAYCVHNMYTSSLNMLLDKRLVCFQQNNTVVQGGLNWFVSIENLSI